MESYVSFQPFVHELAKIQCPTLILNGEFDFLTPRLCHDTLRQNIRSSRLMIVPRAFHAFTLEYPELTVRIVEAFVRSVLEGKWQGDQSVWVASEDPHSDVLATRCIGDHLRAVFVCPPDHQPKAEDAWRVPLSGSEAVKPAGKSAKSATVAPKKTAAEKKSPTAKPVTGKATLPRKTAGKTTKTPAARAAQSTKKG